MTLLLLSRKRFQPRSIPNLQLWLDATQMGVQGYSLDFDGTDDFVQANNVITAYPFTLECWVRFDVKFVDQRFLFISETGVTNKKFGLFFNGNKMGIFVQNGATSNATAGATEMAANIWYHVAGVFSSATDRKLYINGNLEFSSTASVNFSNSANNRVEIGRQTDNNANNLNGKLSDVRIWNTARTAQEIADNYQKRLIGNESGLVGYWKLDRGTGTTVTDWTSNNNTGTITGAIWDNSEPLTEPIDDNTAIRVWQDQSGNAYNAEQSTSAARPTYIASGLNGLPVVRFDGTDDRLSLVSGALGMLRNVAGATVFAVVKYPATSALQVAFNVSLGTIANGTRIGLHQSIQKKYRAAGRRLDADSLQEVVSNPDVTNNFVIQSAIANYQNTLLQQYINGGLNGQKTDFQTAGNTSDTNSLGIFLGANETSNFLNGDIAEIIVYNRALNTSELAQVHRYLARKWGIALA